MGGRDADRPGGIGGVGAVEQPARGQGPTRASNKLTNRQQQPVAHQVSLMYEAKRPMSRSKVTKADM